MSKMNLPGFTAEDSLYSGGGHYVADAAFSTAGSGQQAVFLQATGGWTGERRLIGGGGWRCWYIWGCYICCTPTWCWYICRGGAASLSTASIE